MDNSEKKPNIGDEKEVKNDVKQDSAPNKDIEKLKYDVEHWKNEYYRAYADMANLRKSMEKEQAENNKYRIEGFVQNLLGVLDAFDAAFQNEAKNDELKNYLIGFQYVHNQLVQVLTDEGIIQICPKIGDKFDVNTMHAVDVVEDPGEENIVKTVSMKGYKLHEHLIRPAMVVVSKHPSINKDVEKKEEETSLKK
jgi:Molecular chaperone GrpE (heat shock protein)